jgi:hypothetical protein
MFAKNIPCQHADGSIYSASSLKQPSSGRQVLDTLFWFRANQCLFLFLSAESLVVKQQIVELENMIYTTNAYWREQETQGQHFRWFNIIYSNGFFQY